MKEIDDWIDVTRMYFITLSAIIKKTLIRLLKGLNILGFLQLGQTIQHVVALAFACYINILGKKINLWNNVILMLIKSFAVEWSTRFQIRELH